MPPKITSVTGMDGRQVDLVFPKSKSKRKPYVEPDWIKEYRLERDRYIYKTTKNEQSKKDILEYYGVKPKTT